MITTEQAKAAVPLRQRIDERIAFYPRGNDGWSIQYRAASGGIIAFNDLATPEMIKAQIRGMIADFVEHSPEPPSELEAFKGRVADAVKDFRDTVGLSDDADIAKASGTRWSHAYNRCLAPILAECAPPEPPKPKFAVGQVARYLENSYMRITDSKFEKGAWMHRFEGSCAYVNETFLRALTPEERG